MILSLEKGEEFVNTYNSGNANSSTKEKVVMEIFEIIYVNLEIFGVYFKDEDLRSDFLFQFYYRIPKILKNYKPSLSSFYTYLTNHLHFYYLTFKGKNVRNEINDAIIAGQESTRWKYLIGEYDLGSNFNFYVAEPEPEYCKIQKPDYVSPELKISKQELEHRRALYFNMPLEHRKIFLLACKACFFLDDDLIDKISTEIKIAPELLCSIVQDLKTACFKRFEKINKCICNRNRYYIKIQLFRYLLFHTHNTKCQLDKLCSSLKHNRYLWQKTKRLNKTQLKSPSSRDIQKYINVYKGTIDKNIAKVLKIWYTSGHEDISGIRKYKQKKRSSRTAPIS